MNYEQRLLASAKFVFEGDARTAAEAQVNCPDFAERRRLSLTKLKDCHGLYGDTLLVSTLFSQYYLLKSMNCGDWVVLIHVFAGDEMGLGKALQAISFLSYLKFSLAYTDELFLILCPLSVTDGWVSEVNQFAPKFTVLRYVGDKQCQRKWKTVVLDQLLQNLCSSGHRDYMELRKYPYERLDGSIRAEERFASIRSFSWNSNSGADSDSAFAFMISTRAGGVGLNLVAADTRRKAKAESVKKKAEEKKLAKWEAEGYESLSVKDLQMVICCRCVDDSGNWGHGGMFYALTKLSPQIPTAYERASEFRRSPSYTNYSASRRFSKISTHHAADDVDNNKPHEWVGLAVVQSYIPRRKVPRSTSIHMSRIGYQDGADRSEWYSVERLLRKYAALYGIKIYVQVLFSS
ncbi:hypothetical protein L2E82_10959 [Cichorium intybus]|uniref:Uncharacterized protein n=2 Tax=Cichorium intybus TaxID=13427 RepID=A0ACB9GC39_CICIN|nr:hypothetical protein L2E82_10957 [Cichorium intybus]KAI3780964.1 hypothetical protein L2E82_10959 [Cichorium intybus]